MLKSEMILYRKSNNMTNNLCNCLQELINIVISRSQFKAKNHDYADIKQEMFTFMMENHTSVPLNASPREIFSYCYTMIRNEALKYSRKQQGHILDGEQQAKVLENVYDSDITTQDTTDALDNNMYCHMNYQQKAKNLKMAGYIPQHQLETGEE